jgi:uncharacterized SAM-binding protein YcdF (DUF218 family)
VFFLLSKTIGTMLLPVNFLIEVGVLGAVLGVRLKTFGRRLLITSIALFAICGFSPLGKWLLYPLEQRFPPWDAARGAPDGIIVLGGAIDPALSAAHGRAAFIRAADRIVATAALARQYPNARILFSGGNANLVSDDSAREADYAIAVFESLGIPRERLTMERRSRNTLENAEFSKAVANPKAGERWLLVTSAYHMPRSIGLFRKAGFAVEPYPVDWRVGGFSDLLTFSSVAVEGLERTDIAVREWIGLTAYWATGKIDTPLPGPGPG